MRHAVSLVDLDLPRAAALHELVAKAALPRSRLGDHADDLCVPRNRSLERRLESRHLALAADELGEASCVGHLQARPHPAHALELEDTDRLRQTPHLVPPEIAQSEEPLAYLGGPFRQVDSPRLGDLLHPRRQVGRMPQRRVVHPEVVTDLPDHDFSRVEAHSYREADALPDAQLVRITA
jgi:hypothetical protein